MRLIPFLRFGGNDRKEEEESDAPPDDLPEPPTDEEAKAEEEEEEQPEEEEKKAEDDNEEKSWGKDDEMLKVFMSVDEEFVDNSGLTSEMEDVPVGDLLDELRTLASAFGIPVSVAKDEAV